MKIDTSHKRRGQRFLPNPPPALSAGRCEHVFGKGAWRQVGVSLSYLVTYGLTSLLDGELTQPVHGLR